MSNSFLLQITSATGHASTLQISLIWPPYGTDTERNFAFTVGLTEIK